MKKPVKKQKKKRIFDHVLTGADLEVDIFFVSAMRLSPLPDTQSTFSLQRAVFHQKHHLPSSIPAAPRLSSSSKDVKSESERQFPSSADAREKGRPIKSPDIKSGPSVNLRQMGRGSG